MRIIYLLCVLFVGLPVSAQFNQVSSAVDGAGSFTSGGSYTNLSAAAQSGGVTVSSGGSVIHYAGFLNTFTLQPDLDHDGDGLADEVDGDNDGDSLSDAAELAGSAFSPNTSTDVNVYDSDSDGMSDGQESISGTNPMDENSLMILTDIHEANSEAVVSWQARGNHERTYLVLAADQAGQPFSRVVFSNTVAGGMAPWHPVTASAADAEAHPSAVYSIYIAP